MLLTCDDVWFGGWRGPSTLVVTGGRVEFGGPVVPAPSAASEPEAHIPGVVLAPFTDSHVHLGLVDAGALIAGGIGRVVDLGWDPEVAGTWPSLTRDPASAWPEVSVAGPLLTAPNGYPSRSGWAPDTASVAVAAPDDADGVVDGVARAAASLVKIALNTDAGPVWDDATLDAVVAAAHARGLPVVAHAQGLGQVRRAARAGVDALAHTPFSERLDDDLIADLARSMTWISTLDIHRGTAAQDIAVDNLARFHRLGGAVLYGTDLGNGALPPGLDGREIAALAAAGLGLDDVVRALTPGSGETGFDTRLVTWLPARPTRLEDLARAAVLSPPALLSLADEQELAE